MFVFSHSGVDLRLAKLTMIQVLCLWVYVTKKCSSLDSRPSYKLYVIKLFAICSRQNAQIIHLYEHSEHSKEVVDSLEVMWRCFETICSIVCTMTVWSLSDSRSHQKPLDEYQMSRTKQTRIPSLPVADLFSLTQKWCSGFQWASVEHKMEIKSFPRKETWRS